VLQLTRKQGLSKMKKQSKRYIDAVSKVEIDKSYELGEAVKLLKDLPAAKFDESVEVAIKTGIDAKQVDQAIRGAFSLPHGIGKKVRVVAFVDDSLVEAAEAAGAVMAGSQALADKIKNEQWFDFDVAIAEPKMMRVVGQLGRILGPKGLMPSPKAGTVVPDPVKAVSEFASGKQEYRNDASGNIHFVVGKVSFEGNVLEDNFNAFYKHIQSIKPSSVKGHYIEKVTIASTMGPGIKVVI
jgi:large subunit ribosomal protein L1